MFTFSYPPAACRIYTNSFGLLLQWLSAGNVASCEKHFTAFALCTKHTKATNYNVCQIWSVFCGHLLESNAIFLLEMGWLTLSFTSKAWAWSEILTHTLLKAGMLKLIYILVRKAFSGLNIHRAWKNFTAGYKEQLFCSTCIHAASGQNQSWCFS